MSEQDQQNKPSEKLAEIFSKMSMSELPAMSCNVQELISLTCSSRSAGTELTKVILKDYSLTNKILQVVNSAYYSMGKTVNSISRAVSVLGFDAVRDMATAIALFEEFVKSGLDKGSISQLLTRSFLSAIQARDMVTEKKLNVAPEEAFICTLLHNLGKIIVCIYLPDKFREIEEKILNGMSEKGAASAILSDLTYLEIGEEVAKFWNLSENVIMSMDSTPPKPINSQDKDAYLHNVACFSNTLIDNICNGSDFGPLLDKYGEMFSVDAEELVEKVESCVEESSDVSDSVRYGLTKLKIRSRLKTTTKNVKLGLLSSATPREQKVKMVVDKEDAAKANSVNDDKGSEELEDLPSSADMSVSDFIREITEMMMGSFNISEFYAKLLKGLYLGIGFNRVIMSVVSVQPSKISLVGRFGLGDIDPEEVNKFEHVLAAGQYAIPNSLRLCKDMMVSGDKLSAFPDNLHFLVKGRNVFLFPICIEKKGIGMIYLDRKNGHPSLSKDEIKNVRLFRDFAVMAIKKLRKGN
jgi:HD-like signal output (HDOD) protein